MADRTAAERQRRYRERKRAEQQKASEVVTEAVTPGVTRDAVTPEVANTPELGPRGRRLWQEISDEAGTLAPGEQLLLEEACRSADRLDQLDRILRGKADDWLRFHAMNEDGSIVKVVVNGALMEVRQQQTTLALLLERLRQSRSGGAAKPPAPTRPAAAASSPTTGPGGEGVPRVASLAARIAAKRGGKAAG